MTILVLGGTGAMGTDIVRLLDRDNNNVIVTSRKHRESASDRVHYVQGNAKDIDFLRQLLRENYDVVIDFMVYTLDEFSDRYQMLLDHTVQYIFISSARVYADAGENEISEDFPRLLDVCEDEEYLATNEYALVKARQENILLKSGRCNWTIVRPSLTYSEDRLQLGVYEKENWLYRALNGRSIIFSEDLLERYYTLTYGHDVAEGIVALIGKPKAIGETFHIVQGTASKWRDVLDTYLDVFERVTGIHPKVVFTQKCTNLDIPGSQYQVIYGRYFNRHFDTSKMDTIIDSGSWLNPQEGLAKCLTAFLQNPEFRPINWQVEAYIDRAAKEITPLSEIATRKEQAQYLCYRYGFEGIYDILRNVKNNCGRLAGKVEMMKDLILGRGGKL